MFREKYGGRVSKPCDYFMPDQCRLAQVLTKADGNVCDNFLPAVNAHPVPAFRESDCNEILGRLYHLERKVGFVLIEIVVYDAHDICGAVRSLAHMANVKEASSAGVYEAAFFAAALTVLVFAQAVMFWETYSGERPKVCSLSHTGPGTCATAGGQDQTYRQQGCEAKVCCKSPRHTDVPFVLLPVAEIMPSLGKNARAHILKCTPILTLRPLEVKDAGIIQTDCAGLDGWFVREVVLGTAGGVVGIDESLLRSYDYIVESRLARLCFCGVGTVVETRG